MQRDAGVHLQHALLARSVVCSYLCICTFRHQLQVVACLFWGVAQLLRLPALQGTVGSTCGPVCSQHCCHLQAPVYLLHPGAEYQVGVALVNPPSGQQLPIRSVSWLRVAPVDGTPLALDLEQEEGEWC